MELYKTPNVLKNDKCKSNYIYIYNIVACTLHIVDLLSSACSLAYMGTFCHTDLELSIFNLRNFFKKIFAHFFNKINIENRAYLDDARDVYFKAECYHIQ